MPNSQPIRIRSSAARAGEARWCALLTGLTLLAALTAGCDKGTSMGAPPSGASEEGNTKEASGSTLTAKQILQKGGLCSEDRAVTEAEEGSEEWVILRVYQLALGPNDEASFKAFRALFPDDRNTRQIKEMYWPRIRKNVAKYMNEPGKAGYTICRIMPTDRGRKYYIKTNDPRQHPPPIEIGERDGENKLLSFTPF